MSNLIKAVLFSLFLFNYQVFAELSEADFKKQSESVSKTLPDSKSINPST